MGTQIRRSLVRRAWRWVHASLQDRTILLLWVVFCTSAGLVAQTPPKKPRPLWMEADNYYEARGQFGKARVVLENVRTHLQNRGTDRTMDYVNPSARLAKLTSRLGDFDRSTKLYEEVESLCGELFGAQSIEVVRVKVGQAVMLYRAQRYESAEAKAREGLASLKGDSQLADIERGQLYQILGTIRAARNDFGEAESALNEAVAILTRQFGESDRRVCGAWLNLAQVLLQSGKLDEARAAFARGNADVVLTPGQASLNDMEIYRSAASLAIADKDFDRARAFADRLFAAQSRLLQDAFPSMSAEERLLAKAQVDLLGLYATLGDPERIAQAVLATKVVSLEERSPSVLPIAEEAVFAALLEPENVEQGMVPAIATLGASSSNDRLRTEAAGTEFRAAPAAFTVSQALQTIPKNSAVVEFVRYQANLGRRNEVRYGALLFASGADGGKVSWFPLGSAKSIDEQLRRWNATVRDPIARVGSAAQLRELYETTWAPMASALPAGTRTIYLAADGELCFVPFAVLLGGDNEFLAEKYRFVQVTATRELLKPRVTGSNAGTVALVANPAFDLNLPSASRPAGARVRQSVVGPNAQLAALPGAQREAAALVTMAKSRGWDVVFLYGSSASESAVASLASPRVVHFGTHGLFLPASGEEGSRNGMDRSALALSGAQTSINGLERGDFFPSLGNDGLLTAREAMALPWRGTWLVTLAACDTGLGEARDGESVLGLRRGFLAAGVENLVFSFWPVLDENSADFMTEFYQDAFQSGNVSTALSETQRRWLMRLRREQGISAAVAVAGGFAINVVAWVKD